MDLKRPVPLWLFLVGLLAVSSVSAGIFLAPKLLVRSDFVLFTTSRSVMVREEPTVLTTGYKPGDANGSAIMIGVKSVNGFTGDVTLSASAPSAVAVRLGESRILLGSDAAMFGLNVTVSMGVAAASLGNYVVTIVGTSGSLSHSVDVSVESQDLGMVASSTFHSFSQGSSASYQITFSSLNGFDGSLSLTQTPLFIFSYGGPYQGRWFVNGTLDKLSVRLSPGIASSVTLTVTAGDFVIPREYNFSVIATYASLNGIWTSSEIFTANVTEASESPPSMVSSSINSGTNATLILDNGGPAAIWITSYTVSDSAGDRAFACLGTDIGCFSAVIIASGSTGRMDVLTNPSCPGFCSNTGNPFTFQTGQSYTIVLTTSRQHTFTYTIKG